MLVLKILAFIPLVFAFPDLKVTWSGGQGYAVKIAVEGKDEVISQCIRSGLEVRYRYSLRLCKRRILWADRCGSERVEMRSLQFDPISESYKVTIDQLGDRQPAGTATTTTLEEALASLTVLNSPALASIGFNPKKYPASRNPSLAVRVVVDCKGDYNETLARISSFLTLGLIDIGTFDSGWVDFSLVR